METPGHIRLRLGKDDRLKSRKAIDQLFKEGKTITAFPLRVKYLAVAETGMRAGFAAPKSAFKTAVARNRVKRLMREAYRLQRMPLTDMLADKEKGMNVFFFCNAAEVPDYETVTKKTEDLLARLTAIVEKN